MTNLLTRNPSRFKSLLNLIDNSVQESSLSLFGPDFKWGASTSAFQSEGAWNEDGKGLSVWDTYSLGKGHIADGSNARQAVDFYHRYRDDLQILHTLNFKNFRFSLSWPRILPAGTGSLNPKGIDYYHRVIDACLDLQIIPWITLYHWDLPQSTGRQRRVDQQRYGRLVFQLCGSLHPYFR